MLGVGLAFEYGSSVSFLASCSTVLLAVLQACPPSAQQPSQRKFSHVQRLHQESQGASWAARIVESTSSDISRTTILESKGGL